MHKIIHLAALLALLLAGTAHAQQFYRCTDSAGKVTLSDKVCDNSAVDASRFVLKPNTLDSREARAQDLRRENQQLREHLQQQQAVPPAQQFGRTNADLQAEKSSSYECHAATKKFEREGSSNARTIMRTACGQPEPARAPRVFVEAPQPRGPVYCTTRGNRTICD